MISIIAAVVVFAIMAGLVVWLHWYINHLPAHQFKPWTDNPDVCVVCGVHRDQHPS